MSKITNLFEFKNNTIQNIEDLKDQLKHPAEKEKIMKMLNTILGINVDYSLLIEFLNRHIDLEK